MSLLLLVRHAQASIDGDDYDRLSQLGHEQGAVLGRYWAELGLAFDRVYVGPCLRHRQTLDEVARVYKERGLAWPDAEELTELDEHDGPRVLDHHRAELLAGDEPPPEGDNEMARYLRRFRRGTRRWIRGELSTPPELEPWSAFRARVVRGLEHIRAAGGRGERVVAFTSGGPLAATAGHALGLDDEQVLDLSWHVRNTAVAELHFSERGFGLASFNALPHFTDARMITYA